MDKLTSSISGRAVEIHNGRIAIQGRPCGIGDLHVDHLSDESLAILKHNDLVAARASLEACGITVAETFHKYLHLRADVLAQFAATNCIDLFQQSRVAFLNNGLRNRIRHGDSGRVATLAILV